MLMPCHILAPVIFPSHCWILMLMSHLVLFDFPPNCLLQLQSPFAGLHCVATNDDAISGHYCWKLMVAHHIFLLSSICHSSCHCMLQCTVPHLLPCITALLMLLHLPSCLLCFLLFMSCFCGHCHCSLHCNIDYKLAPNSKTVKSQNYNQSSYWCHHLI